MSDNLSDRLQRAADRFVAASLERGFIYGVVGRQNENGGYSVVVAGRPNYLYVTVDGEQASTIARAGATPRVAGLPVRMKREQGELVIVDVNQLALGAFLEGGAGGYNVAFHHHNEGSGLEYAINSTRLKPGRVRFVSALTVHIGEFAYSHGGEWRWWPGGNIDLTSVQPATADTWAWVLVGIDPATNAAVAVAGAAQAVGVELTVNQLEAIAFNGYIPCGAVRVRADDTALNLASRYADARIWLDRLGASGGGGGDVAAEIDNADEKVEPDGTDKFGLVEGGLLKWLSWDNLAAGVQAALDSVYFRLTGRAGGQVAHGGTGSGETLTLRGSAHATSGGVVVDDDLETTGGLDVGGWDGRPVPIHPHGSILGDMFLGNVGANVPRLRMGSNANAGFAQWNRYFDGTASQQIDTSMPTWSVRLDGGTDRVEFQRSPPGSTSLATLLMLLGDGNMGVGVEPLRRFHVRDGSAGSISPNTNASVVIERNGSNFVHIFSSDANPAAILFGSSAAEIKGAVLVAADEALVLRAGGNTTRIYVHQSGRVSIGSAAPATSAKLDIQGTDGALLLSRLTAAQIAALTAANGMMALNTTTGALDARVGGAWREAAHPNAATKSVSGVAGTAVTLLPAGTVTGKLQASGAVVTSGGVSSTFAIALSGGSTQLTPGGGGTIIFTAPSGDLELRVESNGAVTTRRISGSITFSVSISMIWV